MNKEAFFDMLVAITGGIATVAIVALIVSKKSQTPQVVQSVGTAYGSWLAVAVSPVTGAVPQANLTYPSSGFGMDSFGSGGGFTPNFQGGF